MTDPRRELAALAREARVMLEREMGRGRERVVMAADSSSVTSPLVLPGFEISKIS